MGPDRFALTLLLTLFSYSSAIILNEPVSQTTFEGQTSFFYCSSNENLFWQINGQLFENSQAKSLEEKGFAFSDTFINEFVNRSLSVMGSRETNNSIIACVSVDRNNNVTLSQNATLTVLESPSNVTLVAASSSTFKLMWKGSSAPEVHNYTVIAQYTSPTQNEVETHKVSVSNETSDYVFEYAAPEALVQLSTCSQFIFSVLATSAVIGDSPPVNVSWEKLLVTTGKIENMQCVLKLNVDGSTTALVEFTFPELCHFQEVSYSFSLSPAETNSLPLATSDNKTYVGSDERDVEGQLLDLNLDLGVFYRVRVMAELVKTGEMIVAPSSICNGPAIQGPSIGSLSGTAGDQFSSGEVIAGIVISSVLLLVTVVMNGAVLVYMCVSKLNKK